MASVNASKRREEKESSLFIVQSKGVDAKEGNADERICMWVRLCIARRHNSPALLLVL